MLSKGHGTPVNKVCTVVVDKRGQSIYKAFGRGAAGCVRDVAAQTVHSVDECRVERLPYTPDRIACKEYHEAVSTIASAGRVQAELQAKHAPPM